VSCSHLPATGDRGQRYEIRAAQRESGEEIVVGWTDAEDGGALARMARVWPYLRAESVRVIDRQEASR